MTLELKGEQEVQRFCLGTPQKLLRAARNTVKIGTALVSGAVPPFTPVLTGALLGSQHSEYEDTADGARGVVESGNLREAHFQEHGGKGGARHMYERGLATQREPIKRIFEGEIRAAL